MIFRAHSPHRRSIFSEDNFSPVLPRGEQQIDPAQDHQGPADLLDDDAALGSLIPVQIPLDDFGTGACSHDHRAVAQSIHQ